MLLLVLALKLLIGGGEDTSQTRAETSVLGVDSEDASVFPLLVAIVGFLESAEADSGAAAAAAVVVLFAMVAFLCSSLASERAVHRNLSETIATDGFGSSDQSRSRS